MITKSDYLAYLQCPLVFWLDRFRPGLRAPLEVDVQRRMRMGQKVDKTAREWFPDGRLIPYRPNPEDMAPLTARAIAAGERALFQATFHADDLLVKVDVLQREEAGWHLIEVKSSTSVKEEHLPDAAFQFYVLHQAGLNISRASIMHINNQCRFPNLDDLFTIEDVTAEVQDWWATIEEDLLEMRRLADLADEPRARIGRFCIKPVKCRYHAHCWQDIDGLTIYHIPRLGADKQEQLETAGALFLEDVTEDFPLTNTQRRFVDFHVGREIRIDRPAIRRALAELRFPLYFFDFETIDHVVPIYEGTGPYQQVPFQYSCHILHEDGTLEHREYLYKGESDPRPDLLRALLRDIEDGGQIVAYNAPFEGGVLKKLAEAFPAEADLLLEMAGRLWDQLPLFRKYYRDYRFGTSNSLKNVLPVVAPHLSYGELAVQNGVQAQVLWEEMVETADGAAKERLAADLLAYCKLDTLAMVEIHGVLREI
ncbi:MAG: DUF2779 domain-containing protein [Candidatus Promineifilaceae bacterium]